MRNLKDPSTLAQLVDMVESTENKERVDRHTRAYNIVNGNQKKISTDDLIKKYPESYAEMTVIDLAIGRKIIRKLSRCYASGAMREIVDQEGIVNDEMTAMMSKVYANISETHEDMNTVMGKANSLYSNHSYVELFSYIGEDKLIRVKPLPQNLFTAIPNKTKTSAEVIVFKQDVSLYWDYERFIDWDSVGASFEDSELLGVYTVWSAEQNFTFVKLKMVISASGIEKEGVVFRHAVLLNEGNASGVNPIGTMPFVGVKASTEGQFYPHGNEISEVSKDLCIIFTDIVSIAALQGYGQAVVYYDGDTPPQINKTGPTHVVAIPNRDGKSKFEFANPNPDLSGHLDIALAITRILLTTNDLTTDKVSGELAATNFASAIDRLIADSETIENIEDQRVKYTNSEKLLFKILLKHLLYLKTTNQWPDEYPVVSKELLDPKKYRLRLTFNTIKPLTTEKEKATTIVYLDENGFILPHEKHMRFNENLSEEEARAREVDISEYKESKMEDQITEVVDANSRANKKNQLKQIGGKEPGTEKEPKNSIPGRQEPVGKRGYRADKKKN